MKKVFVSFKKALLLFGVLLLIQSVSCTTKYLTKDQLPQDKITFLDEKDQFEITFDYNQTYTLLPDGEGGKMMNGGEKGLVIGTISGAGEQYVIEIKDETISHRDFKYVFTDKWSIDASKTAAKERDKKIEQEEAKAKKLGYPSVEAYNEAIDKAEEKREKAANKAAEEKREKELYSKSHYWLICEAKRYSELPPSYTKAFLKKFPLEAFDDKGKCADAAWYKNQMANQMGIECSCRFLRLNRKKAEALVGKERMP